MAMNSASLITCCQIDPVAAALPSAACEAAIVVETAIRMPNPSSPAEASSSSCTDAYGRSRKRCPSAGGSSL
jgi:hypothetical protein